MTTAQTVLDRYAGLFDTGAQQPAWLLDQRQQALATRAQQLEDQMARRQSELAKPIMDKINNVLQDIRTQGGYAIILDAAAGGIVSADPAIDLTETVLTRLKATASAATSR